MLYLRDLTYALWAWMSVWFISDRSKLERRIRFVDDAVDEKRKKQLPYKLIKAAYKKRLQPARDEPPQEAEYYYGPNEKNFYSDDPKIN